MVDLWILIPRFWSITLAMDRLEYSSRHSQRKKSCFPNLLKSFFVCSIIYIVYAFLILVPRPLIHSSRTNNTVDSAGSKIIKSWPLDLLRASSSQSNTKRILLQVGGIPSEGFGATLAYLKPAISVATALQVDFQAVRTFDFRSEYNVVDELNIGIDFTKYNWQNMCNLHSAAFSAQEDHDRSWDIRVKKLRENYNRLLQESAKLVKNETFDLEYINLVRSRLASCDVIILGDQELHRTIEWRRDAREWISERLFYNARSKAIARKAKLDSPADIHLHYRWGDMARAIAPHTNKKWCFNETAAEFTIKSVERCIGRQLKTKTFMKRSQDNESEEQLRKIIAPLRPQTQFAQEADDIVDLVNLSSAKILVTTSGSYSVTAAAIGKPLLLIHNGELSERFNFVKEDGGIMLEQGVEISEPQCQYLRVNL